MDKIVSKFLLAGDKFIPDVHLKMPGFTSSACGPFAKNKERIKNVKKNRRFTIYLSKRIR